MSMHGDVRGARRWIEYAPQDGVVYTSVQLGGEAYARGLYVAETGDVSFINVDGSISTLPGLLGGVIHPIHTIGIRNTGTTAGTVYVCF